MVPDQHLVLADPGDLPRGPNWVTAAWAPAALVWSSTRNVAVAGGWYHDFLAAQA
jgi:hypothetical protein